MQIFGIGGLFPYPLRSSSNFCENHASTVFTLSQTWRHGEFERAEPQVPPARHQAQTDECGSSLVPVNASQFLWVVAKTLYSGEKKQSTAMQANTSRTPGQNGRSGEDSDRSFERGILCAGLPKHELYQSFDETFRHFSNFWKNPTFSHFASRFHH